MVGKIAGFYTWKWLKTHVKCVFSVRLHPITCFKGKSVKAGMKVELKIIGPNVV